MEKEPNGINKTSVLGHLRGLLQDFERLCEAGKGHHVDGMAALAFFEDQLVFARRHCSEAEISAIIHPITRTTENEHATSKTAAKGRAYFAEAVNSAIEIENGGKLRNLQRKSLLPKTKTEDMQRK